MARNGSSWCVFCDGRAVRSRVLPTWLDKAFPEHPPLAARRALTCRRCNRGWLTELEKRAMPMVTWMSEGRTVTLSRQNQETVALWGAKTILMLEAIREPDRLPLDAFRQMRETRCPPSGFVIAIAMRSREGRWPYRFAAQGDAIERYRAELCIGELVIRADAQFAAAANPLGVTLGSAAIPIWPAPGGSVRFPPAHGLVRAA